MEAYVTHYTPLKDRKDHIIKQLEREELRPIFIEAYDREALTEDDLSKYDTTQLKLSSISLILKHIEAWRQIVSSDKSYGLIFEDDAILCNDFQQKLRGYMEELPPDYDILMINSGCNMHIPEEMQAEDMHVYLRGVNYTPWGGDGGTRCTDAYVISQKCARVFLKIYESAEKKSIHLAIDWWMNTLMRRANANVYWGEPSLVLQGSETGLFEKS